jgi:hypothetical protein
MRASRRSAGQQAIMVRALADKAGTDWLIRTSDVMDADDDFSGSVKHKEYDHGDLASLLSAEGRLALVKIANPITCSPFEKLANRTGWLPREAQFVLSHLV